MSGNSTTGGTGGGIRFLSNYSQTLELTRTRVFGNTSVIQGAGLNVVGGNVTVAVTDSVISNNRTYGSVDFPTAGAGLRAAGDADVTLTRTTISGNVVAGLNAPYPAIAPPSLGGGLAAVRGASITLDNCTVSGNAAIGAVTAFGAGPSRGGGVFVDGSSSLTVRNTTVAANRIESGGPAEGGGLFVEAGGTATVGSTVLAANVAGPGGVDASGAVVSLGANLVGDGTGATGFVTSDQVGVAAAPIDARLGPLADNGGPTPTHALLPGSPAIDRGSNPSALAADQRGLPRTRGAGTDVGAFERQPPALTSGPSAAFAVRLPGTHTVTTTGDGPITLSAVGPLPSGLTFTDNGDGTATLTGASLFGGTFPLTIAAANGTSEPPTQRFVLTVEPIPVPLTAVASGPGVPVTVNVYAADGSLRFALTPYPGFTGGATVATGDLTGDGVDDIVTGAGPGGGPHVKVFDGATGAELRSFFAYDPAARVGVDVAVADLNGDGTAELLTGAGAGGGPHVKAFRYADLAELRSFFAFDPESRSGVAVAGLEGLIVAGATPGQPGAVRLFGFADGQSVATFFPFGEAFTGGLSVTADAGRIAVGAGPGGGPAVAVLAPDGTGVATFFAFDESFRGGVTVGSTGGPDPRLVVGAGPGGGPAVSVYSPDRTLARSFFAFAPSFVGGVFVG